jgi:hypothetical protein
MSSAPDTFEAWLDETFGRAVVGEFYPQFVHRDVAEWPDPVPDTRALEYVTRVFEHPVNSLRFFSDGQIAAGLGELGPGDAHCLYNRDLPVADRERLIASVGIFFRDFFDRRCIPALSHTARAHISPLNTACYMWWENILMGGTADDPAAEYLHDKDLDVMEAVLQLPNVACKEAALHGLGHDVGRDGRAGAIIDRFLVDTGSLHPDLAMYARAARSGCIQ